MTAPSGSKLLVLATMTGAFAVYVALTGGIDTRFLGVPLRSRSWERPAAVASVLAVAGLLAYRRQLWAFISRAGHQAAKTIPKLARPLPLIAASASGLTAMAFGTWAAGGADSYGYVSQAELFVDGRLTDAMPRNRAFTWPRVQYTLAPLGYKEGATRWTLAPTYPPGLPLLMTPFAAIDRRAVFLVVPLCAAIAVWSCFRIGRELGGPLIGRWSAVLLAVSPTFLYQAVQPMSDVPATAFWLTGLVLARHPAAWSAAAAGVVTSMAILIRPNLAPLALCILAAATTLAGKPAWRRALDCAAGMIPGVFALGAIQFVRYGSAFASGYGKFDELFAIANITPNLARYPRWLTETHTPFIWLWLLAPLAIIRAESEVRTLGWICYAFSIAVFTAYLPYSYFRPEEWFYTRFLLPAIPLFLVLGTWVIADIAQRTRVRAVKWAGMLLLATMVVVLAARSARFGAFEIRHGEQKYPAVGQFVRERLPETAFVMAMQHSGSIRYYSGRHTLRWDLLERTSLQQVVSSLRAAGYSPFAVLDEDEDLAFRQRFGVASADALEQMFPVAKVGGTHVYGFR